MKTKIEINTKIDNRIKAFKDVIETVIDEKIGLDDCIEIILDRGMNSMLEDILGQVEPATLLSSFQQLGTKYPAEVYSYIAETLRRGGEINKEALKNAIGFRISK